MANLITRWQVQENIGDDMWIPWTSGKFEYRFWYLERAKKHYEEYKD